MNLYDIIDQQTGAVMQSRTQAVNAHDWITSQGIDYGAATQLLANIDCGDWAAVRAGGIEVRTAAPLAV